MRQLFPPLSSGWANSGGSLFGALLDGAPGPYRDVVLFNAAAALMIAGKVADITDGVAMAARSIDDNHAAEKLAQLVEITNRAVAP